MDSTHAAVGIGAGGSVGVLAGLIAGTWHLDPTLSADWAMAVVGAAGFVGGYVTWFIRWKWPGAPPLPGVTWTATRFSRLPLAAAPPVIPPMPAQSAEPKPSLILPDAPHPAPGASP